MATQNLWDKVKAGLRGKFITTQAYFKKQEKQQINNLTLNLKQLENEAQKNPQKKHRKMKHTKKNVSRRKEIIQITAEINEKQ